MRKILVFVLISMLITTLYAQKDSKNNDKIVMSGKMYSKNKDIEPIKFSIIEKSKGSYTLVLIQKDGNDSLPKKGEEIKDIFKKQIDSSLNFRFLINEKKESCFLIYFSDHELGHIGIIKLLWLVNKTMNKIEKKLDCSVKTEQYVL